MDAVLGLVKNGKVELDNPLPEGTRVECRPVDPKYGMPQEFWDDLAMFQQSSADALARVEQMFEEIEKNEPR